MSGYQVALVVHVVIALLGAGGVGALALLAISTRDDRRALAMSAPLTLMLRSTLWSLVALFASGVALEAGSGAVFHGSLWFRASAALLLVTGVGHALTRRAWRTKTGLAAVRAVRAGALAMCGLVIVIIALMEVKPP